MDLILFSCRLYCGLCSVVQWSVHWAPSRTTRVLVLAGARRCALETCEKKNARSDFRLGSIYIILIFPHPWQLFRSPPLPLHSVGDDWSILCFPWKLYDFHKNPPLINKQASPQWYFVALLINNAELLCFILSPHSFRCSRSYTRVTRRFPWTLIRPVKIATMCASWRYIDTELLML